MVTQQLINILHESGCSLVVYSQSEITTYNKPGVRDLEHLLDHSPATLQGAIVADKVVGKAAAGMMAVGGVKQVFADVMSRRAIPFLETAGITFSYGTLTDAIQEAGDHCKLEQITEKATTSEEIVALLRAHFAQMKSLQLTQRQNFLSHTETQL